MNDLTIITRCCAALDQSSTRMLRANLDYLWDRYVGHPPADGVAKGRASSPPTTRRHGARGGR